MADCGDVDDGCDGGDDDDDGVGGCVVDRSVWVGYVVLLEAVGR